MTPNESIVEDAALAWFLLRQGYGGQVGEQTRCARTLTRPLPSAISGALRFPRGEEWQLCYTVGHGPQIASGDAEAERATFGKVVLAGRFRAALRQLRPVIPESSSLAALLPKRLSGELSGGLASAIMEVSA